MECFIVDGRAGRREAHLGQGDLGRRVGKRVPGLRLRLRAANHYQPLHRPDVLHWYARAGGEGRTFDLFPGLARVKCPTLVLGGEEDPMTPIECQADIAAALPARLVRFERFANAGHGVIGDVPERAFAVVREFIGR